MVGLEAVSLSFLLLQYRKAALGPLWLDRQLLPKALVTLPVNAS